MKKQIVISIMAKDRPGIIGEVTGLLYQLNGDVADLQQTVLCGYLSMILGVTLPEGVSSQEAVQAITTLKEGAEFEISVKELAGSENFNAHPLPDETYMVTAQGPNRPGIVHHVSAICARHHINILDLSTNLQQQRYTMALQLDLSSAACSHAELRRELEEYGEKAGQTIMMQHYEIFRATNEVTLH